ncbi:hypothetical protein [Gemmobacter sp.]|uniref:hypothetical protein n=1 Tax=Gemmobacter sp. TaxID=1898957 RepID=UPI002AFF6E5C|nr:hypothetical protein [Gemmobacter sp.]
MTYPIDTSPEAIAALLAKYTSAFGLASEAYDKGYRNAEKALAAEIVRLTSERDELRAAIFGGKNYAADLRNGNFVEMANTLHVAQKGGLARAEKAEAERDEAHAQVAMAFEAAAQKAYNDAGRYDTPDRIRALTPANAAAALAHRDAAMRNEERRQAALLGNNLPDVRFDDRWTDYEHGVCDFQRAILAALEPEGGQ